MRTPFTKLLAVVALGGCQLEPLQPVQKPTSAPNDAATAAPDAAAAVMVPRRLRSGGPAPGNVATRAPRRDSE